MFTFVTGGLRSGKSVYALRRASELGPPPWLYVSTTDEPDADLKRRLSRDRRDQDAIWKALSAPPQLAAVLDADKIAGHGAIVLDGFTQWLAARLGANGAKSTPADMLKEVETLADRMYRSTVPIVLVTTEVGLGATPQLLAERGFLDVAGQANQILAERADSVVLMVSGVALRLR